jgi:hypothetical protein
MFMTRNKNRGSPRKFDQERFGILVLGGRHVCSATEFLDAESQGVIKRHCRSHCDAHGNLPRTN